MPVHIQWRREDSKISVGPSLYIKGLRSRLEQLKQTLSPELLQDSTHVTTLGGDVPANNELE